jgi:sulfite reductase alpha subunit-like flavoprotein
MWQNARPGQLEVTYAIRHEMTNAKLEQGALIYVCGRNGMMPGILQALEQVARARGIDWQSRRRLM